MYTGLYPHQTGIECNRSHPRNPDPGKPTDGAPLPDDMPGMGVWFASAGFDTAYFGKWHLNFAKENHSQHGFATTGVLRDTGHDPAIAEAAAGYLRAERDRPFLVAVNFCDPHDICQYADGRALPGGPLPLPPGLDDLPSMVSNVAATREAGDILDRLRLAYQQVHVPMDDGTPGGVRRCRELVWAYHRLIERVDRCIDTVLKALDASPHRDDTIVIYTSDHGELLGAHGLVQKTLFYEECVHVPFIVHTPGGRSATSDHFVSGSVDLLPTTLDAVGLSIPSSLPGRSVWPVVCGEVADDGSGYVISQVHFCHPKMPPDTPHTYGRMVRTAQHSYWLFDKGDDREVLFDHACDPGELINVAARPAYRGVIHRHRRHLKNHADHTADFKARKMIAGLN